MTFEVKTSYPSSARFKGIVSREKLFSWGLGEMDWTLTIDRTWFSHFPDQLFNCYNFLTVFCLDVKPVWWLSGTVALRRLIVHAVVAVSCPKVYGLQASSAPPHAGKVLHPPAHLPDSPPPPSHWPLHSAHAHRTHKHCTLTVLLLKSTP